MVIRHVETLKGINPENFAGDVFILPNGEMFQANSGDQLGGFWSKLLGIAAPFAAIIPGAGAIISPLLGAAAGALEQKEAHKNDANNELISQTAASYDSILDALTNGKITSNEAMATMKTVYDNWTELKFAKKEDDRNYLYETGDLQILEPKMKAIEAKANEVAKTETAKAAQAATATDTPFGLSYTELAIGAVAFYFLFLRS